MTASVPFVRSAMVVVFAMLAHGRALAAEATGDPQLLPTEVPEGVSVQTAIHGQTTFITQSVLPFPSRYSGDASLSSHGETKSTWTATLAAGVRLWKGAELYFDPEMFRGFGLDASHGAAAFPNGEAQKGGTEMPIGYVARLFLRQVIGFGGETETVKDDFNQLGGARDVNRLTLTVGKLSVSDIFDTNSYANDPRSDFFNWAMWDATSFDYAANLKGYTWGAVADLNRKDYALRLGYFLEPVAPSADPIDDNIAHRGQLILEFEPTYTLFGQPGSFSVAGIYTRAISADYRQAIAVAQSTGANINTVTAATRTTRTKSGLIGSVEQAIADDFGVFMRWGWNTGNTENTSFTDADWSASGGIVIKGGSWGRANDKIGIAGAVSGISGLHQGWLNAGALGLLIGDGRLTHYGTENVLEGFYNYEIRRGFNFSVDAQLIENPAYNADRGPVGVFAGRMHGQF